MGFKHIQMFGLAAVALAGMTFVACGGDDDDGALRTKVAGSQVATAATTKEPGATSAATSAPKPAEGDEVEVKLTENQFTPNTITVTAGKTITFKAKNEGAAVHNMKILSAKTEGKDFVSDITINPGKESKFTAKFTKKGTVKFQCDYHLPDMVGTIEVK